MKISLKIISILFMIPFMQFVCASKRPQSGQWENIELDKTIPQLSQMFQKVRVADLPQSDEWDKAMEETKSTFHTMFFNDEKNFRKTYNFYNAIQDLNTALKKFVESQKAEKGKVGGLLSGSKKFSLNAALLNKKKAAQTLAQSSKSFGQKVKSFFSKKNTNDTDNAKNMMNLLRGALSLLEKRIASLPK